MADVVFVCVREDLARAEALAQAFERAGFSIATNVSDDALDACAAGVIVISAASARAETFVERAHWVIDSGKAVIISLVETPRVMREPSQIFDLSAWHGEPGALVLEPVICAIDRLVIAARMISEEAVADAEGDDAVASPPSRWADLPPLKLEAPPPRATPKVPRAYLPVGAVRRPAPRFDPRVTLAATLCSLLIAGGAIASGLMPRAPAAAPLVAERVALQSSSAPVVTFETAVADHVRADSVAYRSEGEAAPIYSPSRAEPPSAVPVLRQLRHPDAPRHYARITLRPPSFIDGIDAPA